MGYLDNTGLAYLWQKVKTLLNAKAPTSHASTATTYGKGTASNYGHVKLSDSTSSTSAASAGIAASPKAVKAAYDLASAAMPKSGGAFTGDITMGSGTNLVLSDGTNIGAELYNISTTANAANTAAATAQSTANAAMPKSGGQFTGNVIAYAYNRSGDSIRSISISDSSGNVVPTNTMFFYRK